MTKKKCVIIPGFSLAAAALVVSQLSCTVGPDYRSPNVTVPSAYGNVAPTTQTTAGLPTTSPTTQSVTVSNGTEPIVEWWTTLQDVELNKLVGQAIAGNINLQEAASRVRESRAELRMTGTNELPSLDATGAFARIDSGKNASLGNNGAIVTNIWRAAGFDTSWEIDCFGGNRRQIEAARADFQALRRRPSAMSWCH